MTEDILSNDVTPTAAQLAERLMNAAIYTTTVLEALARIHFEAGDKEGAFRLREFAEAFATHEASTL